MLFQLIPGGLIQDEFMEALATVAAAALAMVAIDAASSNW